MLNGEKNSKFLNINKISVCSDRKLNRRTLISKICCSHLLITVYNRVNKILESLLIMSCKEQQPFISEVDGISLFMQGKSQAPSQYLDQLKATIECDRRFHALISYYTELLKRVEQVELQIVKLS